MSPQQAGLAMAPTSLAGFAVSLTVLPRVLDAIGPVRSLVLGLVVLAAGHLWLAYVPAGPGYVVAVLPGLLLVATGVALSFTPTTMVLASAVPGRTPAWPQVWPAPRCRSVARSGPPCSSSSASQPVTPVDGALDPSGFSAAFTAAAVVALLTAALGATLARPRR